MTLRAEKNTNLHDSQSALSLPPNKTHPVGETVSFLEHAELTLIIKILVGRGAEGKLAYWGSDASFCSSWSDLPLNKSTLKAVGDVSFSFWSWLSYTLLPRAPSQDSDIWKAVEPKRDFFFWDDEKADGVKLCQQEESSHGNISC